MKIKQVLQLLIIILIATACASNRHIEKRRYLPGYYSCGVKSKKATKSLESNLSNSTLVLSAQRLVSHSDVSIKTPSMEAVLQANATDETPQFTFNSKQLIFFKPKTAKQNINPDTCGDVITLKNGEQIIAKVIEITDEEIKYKRCDNINGPLFIIKKSKIALLTYANGSKELDLETDTKLAISYNAKPDVIDINKQLDIKQSKLARNMGIAAIISFFSVIFSPLIFIFCPAALVFGSKVKNRGTVTDSSSEMSRSNFGIGIGLAFFIGWAAFFVWLAVALTVYPLFLVSLVLVIIAVLIRKYV